MGCGQKLSHEDEMWILMSVTITETMMETMILTAFSYMMFLSLVLFFRVTISRRKWLARERQSESISELSHRIFMKMLIAVLVPALWLLMLIQFMEVSETGSQAVSVGALIAAVAFLMALMTVPWVYAAMYFEDVHIVHDEGISGWSFFRGSWFTPWESVDSVRLLHRYDLAIRVKLVAGIGPWILVKAGGREFRIDTGLRGVKMLGLKLISVVPREKFRDAHDLHLLKTALSIDDDSQAP